jgi:hypothetical protein
MERYVNNVKGSHSDWSDTDIIYSPHEGMEKFHVPVFEIPTSKVSILCANPDPRLVQEVIVGDKVKFFVHPDMLNDKGFLQKIGIDGFIKSNDVYEVTPTSSTRTLLTLEKNYNFMIKTDLDKKHFRFIRRLKGDSVEHSILISKELEKIANSGECPEYSFLPESLGFILGDKVEGSGVLFREIFPRPLVKGQNERFMIPYFSLYASDLKNPNEPALLIQLIEINTKTDQEKIDFFINEIIGKIIRVWCYFVNKQGMLLELHGQNTLLELGPDLKPTRIVHRDFQGIYTDKETRDRLGLQTIVIKHIVGEESGTSRQSQYSLNFDHIMGDFLFDRLIKTFTANYHQFSLEEIITRIKKIFHENFPDSEKVFPSVTYTFGVQNENNVNLVENKSKPTYR